MAGTNAKNYVNSTCTALDDVKRYLRGAADNVENHTTKERIETQLSNVEKCLNECNNILNSLK